MPGTRQCDTRTAPLDAIAAASKNKSLLRLSVRRQNSSPGPSRSNKRSRIASLSITGSDNAGPSRSASVVLPLAGNPDTTMNRFGTLANSRTAARRDRPRESRRALGSLQFKPKLLLNGSEDRRAHRRAVRERTRACSGRLRTSRSNWRDNTVASTSVVIRVPARWPHDLRVPEPLGAVLSRSFGPPFAAVSRYTGSCFVSRCVLSANSQRVTQERLFVVECGNRAAHASKRLSSQSDTAGPPCRGDASPAVFAATAYCTCAARLACPLAQISCGSGYGRRVASQAGVCAARAAARRRLRIAYSGTDVRLRPWVVLDDW
jgi:hypothetical protein